MLSAVKNKQINLHQLGDTSYLLLGAWHKDIAQTINQYDAIIITTTSAEAFEDLVRKVRTHSDSTVALKPLFYKFDVKSTYKIHTDGIFQDLLSNETTKHLRQKISELSDIYARSTDEQISLQLLQHLFTREGMLKPVKSRFSKLTYQYPIIDLFFEQEEFHLIKNLQHLVKEGLLEEKLKDRTQLCQDCNDGFLLFKETCPKCHSIDIESFDVIHHFVCAHVAPEADYKNDENDQLSCPKCDKHLRHIGIDYDKPSTVYHCKSCSHDFQNAEVVAECHSCNKKNDLNELVEVNINDYKLTMKGMAKARNGSFGIRETIIQSEENIFKELIKHEKARGTEGYIIQIDIKSPFFSMLDKKYKAKFWEEIKGMIKDYTPFHERLFQQGERLQFMLLDASEKQCEETCQRLKFNLDILLKDNLGGGIQVDIATEAIKSYPV